MLGPLFWETALFQIAQVVGVVLFACWVMKPERGGLHLLALSGHVLAIDFN